MAVGGGESRDFEVTRLLSVILLLVTFIVGGWLAVLLCAPSTITHHEMVRLCFHRDIVAHTHKRYVLFHV